MYQQIPITQNFEHLLPLFCEIFFVVKPACQPANDFYMIIELWHNNQPYQLFDYGFNHNHHCNRQNPRCFKVIKLT
ncbi:hypothetical protein ENHAE0001_0551 [Enhydrobacter aerosaccus SK60]|nr:hypothetical protein ENHAE0001_0551 [Enhydrobacter aerosaccus SK60]